MLDYINILVVLSVVLPGCLAEYCGGDYCGYNEYCCGSVYNRYCCHSSSYLGTSGWAGICVSGLFITGLVILVLICCCNRSCYLNRRYHGQVIQTHQGGTVVSTVHQPYVASPQGYPQPAQGYPQAYPAQGYPQQPQPQPQPQGYNTTPTGYANQGFTSAPPSYQQAASTPATETKPPPYNPNYE